MTLSCRQLASNIAMSLGTRGTRDGGGGWGGGVVLTCSKGLLERVMAGGSTLSVTRGLCWGWRCSRVVHRVRLRAAMSRSVSFTKGATSSTADCILLGCMLLPCEAIKTYTNKRSAIIGGPHSLSA